MNVLISRVEILKLVAHPARITILGELSKGVKCVSDLEGFLELSQPNISQHLAALRRAGIIDYFIDGKLRCYFLKNPIVVDILEILSKEYSGDLPGPECCPTTKKGTYPGKRDGNV
ncbi:MAG TPA: ArsR family transcriptional regulator [Nitrospirae bacterium]|nr:biofilm growth-associated repressor [bacterium BMS3Abin10]GBE39114.1 biofilm growth-associated repressor [bacterium BMS3Bbin08]HDH51315.1 ArsR family transcriptional regulator [Nitrospirota bacterium]HDK81649.1 ArsR family transcriptional regulator [Nitrospirota bacterium]